MLTIIITAAIIMHCYGITIVIYITHVIGSSKVTQVILPIVDLKSLLRKGNRLMHTFYDLIN